MQSKYDLIKYHYFRDFVPICDSFSRSINTASGKYIILWGDDDIASPYVIDFILDLIRDNDNVGLIHYNVAIGTDKIYDITLNRFETEKYESLISANNLSDFLVKHTVTCGFITAMVFLRDAWYKGLKFHKDYHYGYEFLPIIYHGVEGMTCLYCSYPLAIQRMPLKRAWLSKWPLYAEIGMPNLIRDLEKDGLTKGAYDYWYSNYNDLKKFIKVLLLASAYKKEYRKRCKEIANNQREWYRKVLTYFIIFCFPAFINNTLRKFAHR